MRREGVLRGAPIYQTGQKYEMQKYKAHEKIRPKKSGAKKSMRREGVLRMAPIYQARRRQGCFQGTFDQKKMFHYF